MMDKKSVIGQLLKRAKELGKELDQVYALLTKELLRTAEFRVGDVVEVITSSWNHPFKKGTKVPSTTRIGQVRKVIADIASGVVEYEVAPQPKTGFHGRNNLYVS
jgi:hypothetical protein